MTRKEFTVGSTERHVVVVDVSTWTLDMKASIDGEDVPLDAIKESPYVPGSNWRWRSFSVGIQEPHQVTVEIITGIPSSILIYVDGKIESV